MRYSEMMIRPMREEVTRLGATELRTVQDVDQVMANPSGTQLFFVNSVCGCAAGSARPGLRLALAHPVRPDQVYTVFAGADLDSTARLRSYLNDYEPSSPSVALLKDGEVVHFVHRYMIEGQPPEAIAADLTAAFDQHCATPSAA